jgi:hypothetical protein
MVATSLRTPVVVELRPQRMLGEDRSYMGGKENVPSKLSVSGVSDLRTYFQRGVMVSLTMSWGKQSSRLLMG